jgi:hypothetical protein
MNLAPLKSYKTSYPNQYEVDLRPLLLSTKPKSWTSSRAGGLVLCALAMAGLAGCSTSFANTADPTGGDSASAPIASRKMNVAPIFDGPQIGFAAPAISESAYRQDPSDTLELSGMVFTTGASSRDYSIIPLGNYPGFSVAMPEDTALRIITEELSKVGLNADKTTKQVAISGDGSEQTLWTFDLSISGGKEPIYIEYIPSSDIETNSELRERTAAGLPEASLDAAQSLHDKLVDVYDESSAAIFYDKQIVFSADETVNLRDQVAEFVEWLKTMGLI